MKLKFLLCVSILYISASFSQSYSGVLTHTNSYFTIEPFNNTSYDDGSAAKLFYDGNNKRIQFWNTDSGTSHTHIHVGNVTANGNLEATGNITVSGSLGVGVTSPTAKLHFKDGNQELRFLTGANSSGYRLDVGLNDGGTNFKNSSGIRGFNFSNGNGNLLNISHNGMVGIGTAAPDEKLTVKGKIHTEEVRVDLSVPGPDYVFKKGYDLKSLEEVQKHIQEHGHLPNIPSAEEMEEKGIELGIMNMKLLEKIEELTLYTIEQQKTIQYLINEINLLKK
jgi:hypothetical protein